MNDTRRRISLVSGLALLGLLGCHDFDKAFTLCQATGNCLDPHPPGVYVDGQSTVEPALGTPEAPFKSLSQALASPDAGTDFYLAQGTYEESGLQLTRPVSLHGGYKGVSDRWQSMGEPSILNGGTVGLSVLGLGEDAGVTLEQLTILSTTPTAAQGTPSIGLRMVDSSGVLLSHVIIQAANGSDGAPGATAAASPGRSGTGGTGGNKTDTSTTPHPRPAGGDPGTTTCDGTAVPGVQGGKGGVGGNDDSSSGTDHGEDGGVGLGPATKGGRGGSGGMGQATFSCGAMSPCIINGDKGTDGTMGAAGDGGTPGSVGDGTGEVSGGTWQAHLAGSGMTGQPGAGGGGGGGGGPSFVESLVSFGGGGGGGGGGGCPGVVGKGGQGGGASIALLLLNSRVEADSCTLTAGNGGAGGAGSTGSPGGLGGLGGAGGVPTTRTDTSPTGNARQSTGGPGGKGGEGGQGGQGGPGGPGGGGPSVGVWCQSGSSFNVRGEATATQVVAGTGGSASTTPFAGTPGLQETFHACPDNTSAP